MNHAAAAAPAELIKSEDAPDAFGFMDEGSFMGEPATRL